MLKTLLLTICLSIFTMPVMAQDEQNSVTHGNVQLHLVVEETTQYEVIEVFGAPNITTIDGSGQEVWVFRRHATVASSESKSGGFMIGIFGGGGGVGAGGGAGFNKSKTGFEQSSRSMTLVIKFDKAKVVSDFSSRSSSF